MASRRTVFALFFRSGIAGLIYQVLWLRRLSVIFGVTVYAASTVLAAFMAGWFRLMSQFVIATTEAFTAMLATVLAGIAIGAALASQVLKTRARLPFWLTIVQAGTGLATLASMAFLLWTVRNGWNTMLLWRAVTIAILPPSILMGLGFPLMLGMATRSIPAGAHARVSDRIGNLYALNVIGAIAGSLAAGFILLPRIGAMNSLIALSAMYLGSAFVMARSRRSALAALAVIAVAFGLIGTRMPDPFKVAIDRRYGDLLLEFWREEGAQTAVSVRATRLQHVLYLGAMSIRASIFRWCAALSSPMALCCSGLAGGRRSSTS